MSVTGAAIGAVASVASSALDNSGAPAGSPPANFGGDRFGGDVHTVEATQFGRVPSDEGGGVLGSNVSAPAALALGVGTLAIVMAARG